MLSVIIGLVLTMPVNAADETGVAVVYAVNTHGKTADWLKGVKPIMARLKVLNPQQNVHVYESQFAGSGSGTIIIVAEHSSMAYMEKMRLKNQGDPELAKLFAAMAGIGATFESSSLLLDRAPDQVKKMESMVQEVYVIDTHGKNDAFVEASKKLHERIYKVIPNLTVRMWESMFAGEGSGSIIIVVGFPSMAEMEKSGAKIADDAETSRLFAERDKLGATIVSRSLDTDVTPK